MSKENGSLNAGQLTLVLQQENLPPIDSRLEQLDSENNELKEQVTSLCRCIENRELELQAARLVQDYYR